MTKITKVEAKKRYEKGLSIVLNPSKMRLNGPWAMAKEVSKKDLDTKISDAPEFDAMCNSFSYYNCTKETGKTIHFYKP